MSHMKPLGYWKCRACGNVCQGEELYQDPMSTALKWTCSDLTCGGTCVNLDPKYIVKVLNAARSGVMENQEKVLNLCRAWYRTAEDITKQTLWYEIGVMLENEPERTGETCPECGGYFNQVVCENCGYH